MPKIVTCFYLQFLLGHRFDFRGIPRAASIPLNGNPTLVLYGEKWQRSRWRFEYRTLQTTLNISYSLHYFCSDQIPFEMRLSYIHAYQSFIWNSIVSKRIAVFGVKPILGDLVYGRNIDGDNTKSTTEMCDDEPQEKMESDLSSNSSNQEKDSHPNIVLIDENNIHYYTIDDVVLPLPGYGAIHPANQVVTWYKELLLADGLSEMDFKRSAKY